MTACWAKCPYLDGIMRCNQLSLHSLHNGGYGEFEELRDFMPTSSFQFQPVKERFRKGWCAPLHFEATGANIQLGFVFASRCELDMLGFGASFENKLGIPIKA